MGLKVHEDGDKLANFGRVMESSGLREIKSIINLVVQMEEGLEVA